MIAKILTKTWILYMSDIQNPWENIKAAPSENAFITLRVTTDTPHDFFWARNHKGQCCLYTVCQLTEKLNLEEVKLKGVEVEQFVSEEKGLELILKLTDESSRDIFRTMCNDLIRATKPIPKEKPKMLMSAINTRVIRWQELLGRKKSELLSRSEQIGLFGELMILKEYFLSKTSLPSGICAWQGPTGSEQDFGWGSNLIEVKTQLSTSDKRVTINSLEQLDNISGNIWLIHQTFAANDMFIQGSQTLASLVSEIGDILKADPFSMDCFRTTLIETGYTDNPKYNEIFYSFNQRNFFHVVDDFPKLTRATTSTAIISARYIIDIGAISSFAQTEKYFLNKVFSHD